MNVWEQRTWFSWVVILLCAVLVKVTHNPLFTFVSLVFVVYLSVGYARVAKLVLEKLLNMEI